MANAKGNLVTLGYIVETTAGTTPSAPVVYLRNKGANPVADIGTTVSAEITSSRDEADLVRTSGKTNMSIPFELSFTEYDPFFASALSGVMSTAVALTATDISASSTDNSINSAAAAFSTANILPGMWIKTKGFSTAANNGIGKVVSVTTAKSYSVRSLSSPKRQVHLSQSTASRYATARRKNTSRWSRSSPTCLPNSSYNGA